MLKDEGETVTFYRMSWNLKTITSNYNMGQGIQEWTK